MILAILVLLGAALLIRITLAIFRNASNKVRSIVTLVVAIALAFWSWSLFDRFRNNLIGENNVFFYTLIVPLLLAIGVGFIFVSINYDDDGDNWHEYFSVGNISYGKDINIGIFIPIVAILVVVTIVFLVCLMIWAYLQYILYGIIHIYFFIRVFFSNIE